MLESHCQRFRKGVGGRGLATNNAQNTAKNVPPRIVFSYSSGGIGKRGQKKGLNLWCWRAFLAPTASVRQPLFETSKSVGGPTSLIKQLETDMRNHAQTNLHNHPQTSRERLYTPPPSSPFLAKRHFSGEGGGSVYFEAPRGRNFIRPPPPFYTPPTPRRVFSGVGGWGCIKFGPARHPIMFASLRCQERRDILFKGLICRDLPRDFSFSFSQKPYQTPRPRKSETPKSDRNKMSQQFPQISRIFKSKP